MHMAIILLHLSQTAMHGIFQRFLYLSFGLAEVRFGDVCFAPYINTSP